MTAKEFIDYMEEDGKYTFGYEECMEEFAKYKCKQLLEIVAGKAKTKNDDFGSSFRGDIIVDKDSILNAVDLDSFISQSFSPKKQQTKYKNMTEIKDNVIELLKEDIECAHTYLDDLKIPREDDKDVFSLVGRIKQLEKRYLKQMSETEDYYLAIME